jgi:hypothetical protein
MLPFGVTIPATVPQESEIPEGLIARYMQNMNIPNLYSLGRIAKGWTVRGSNSGVERDFPHPSRPALGPTEPPV